MLADSNRKLLPWWTVNLGEDIVDMQVVTTQGSKTAVLVLGVNNLYCIKESGNVELVKRLLFNPSSLHAYVTGEMTSCIYVSHSSLEVL